MTEKKAFGLFRLSSHTAAIISFASIFLAVSTFSQSGYESSEFDSGSYEKKTEPVTRDNFKMNDALGNLASFAGKQESRPEVRSPQKGDAWRWNHKYFIRWSGYQGSDGKGDPVQIRPRVNAVVSALLGLLVSRPRNWRKTKANHRKQENGFGKYFCSHFQPPSMNNKNIQKTPTL